MSTVTKYAAVSVAGWTGTNEYVFFVLSNPPPAPGTPDRVLVLRGTQVTRNQTVGGAARSGGIAGLGQGGGLYNQTGAVAFADAFTEIMENTATDGFDDIFGIVTPI